MCPGVGGQGRITAILSPPDPANVAYRPLDFPERVGDLLFAELRLLHRSVSFERDRRSRHSALVFRCPSFRGRRHWVGGQGRITAILSPPDPANVAYRPRDERRELQAEVRAQEAVALVKGHEVIWRLEEGLSRGHICFSGPGSRGETGPRRMRSPTWSFPQSASLLPLDPLLPRDFVPRNAALRFSQLEGSLRAAPPTRRGYTPPLTPPVMIDEPAGGGSGFARPVGQFSIAPSNYTG